MRQPTRTGKSAVAKAPAKAATEPSRRPSRQRLPLRTMIKNLEKAKGQEKLDLLEQYGSAGLKQFLGYIYDPRVQFTTLGDLPGYNPLDPNDSKVQRVDDAAWELLTKGPSGGFPPVYYLTDHGRGGYTHEKLQEKAKAMLERIHPEDAVILESMFFKEMVAGITRKMLESVWPKWTSEWPK